jgi:hypothetical protein
MDGMRGETWEAGQHHRQVPAPGAVGRLLFGAWVRNGNEEQV